MTCFNQVRGLYRGLAAPLIGGALETGISYTVSPMHRCCHHEPPTDCCFCYLQVYTYTMGQLTVCPAG